RAAAAIRTFDPRPSYLSALTALLDSACIRKARLKIAVDCLYGTCRGYLDELLVRWGLSPVVIHDYLNPSFGGRPPEPAREFIPELRAAVKKNKFHLGLACDGDADRFGIVDAGGVFLTPNEVFSLALAYLIRTRGAARTVARSLATTHFIDAIARREGLEVVETPVGFKYIGEALHGGDCLIGGEESGGLSIRGHVPEKDGVLACLLMAEMAAREKKTLSVLLRELRARYGSYYADKINVHLRPEQQRQVLKKIERYRTAKSFAGMAIRRRDFRDGCKLLFAEDHWVLFRASGTEPVVRCYCEASSRARLRALVALAKKELGV
ncbi:MAG: phosphoglucomutase/phosphomannomutase family protein, partial [Candidatus Omnitrophica bacterium]|nr:phosphoglucomutase/phosphomannomutase family protein [Candidatus Omnitrophota bacterium]